MQYVKLNNSGNEDSTDPNYTSGNQRDQKTVEVNKYLSNYITYFHSKTLVNKINISVLTKPITATKIAKQWKWKMSQIYNRNSITKNEEKSTKDIGSLEGKTSNILQITVLDESISF